MWVNGMSDHDIQVIVSHNITTLSTDNHFYFRSKFNRTSVLEFNIQLMYKSWDNVFAYEDMNPSFNNFFNTYLRLFN